MAPCGCGRRARPSTGKSSVRRKGTPSKKTIASSRKKFRRLKAKSTTRIKIK